MSDTLTRTATDRPTAITGPEDVICRRHLGEGRGWTWDGQTFCEPCHRHTRGDAATDQLILSDYARFSEWWTYELFTRADRYPTVPDQEAPDAG